MPVVMGTAGHIDHGKTTLIQALTGTDCDRLEEEKRRGITIELGFAELPLPGGRSLSVVDVPGHERFVRTMVAGAAGVDFVLMVVAADEGVMPQTREHLEICSLLGIRTGVVALTKVDAVDEEMLALAHDDISSFLAGTVLEGAPVVPISARTGQGLDTLVDVLADIEKTLAPVRSHDLFRLPVDRVFTLRGHGTVVTGTMIAGSVNVGDTVEVYPSGLRSKVRGLQSHGAATERALAGRRTAVNIPDLAVEDVRKGEVLGHPDALFPSLRWDLELTCLPSSPRALRHRAEVHFHHGAREMQARLYFVDRDRLQPGESCLCEARFTETAAAVFGDRVVIRSFSPLRTIAGGVVLNPLGVDLRRRSSGFATRCDRLSSLARLLDKTGDDSGRAEENEDCVLSQLRITEGAAGGISFPRLRVLANLDSRVLEKALAGLSNRQRAFCFDKDLRLYIAENFLDGLAVSCETAVDAFHKRFPEKQGIKRSELVSGWGKNAPAKLAHFVIERLLKQGKLSSEGEFLRRPEHSAAFSTKQAPLSEALLAAFAKGGMAPPNINTLLDELKVSKKEAAPVLAALRDSGRLVRVSEDVWYAAQYLTEIESAVRHWFESNENLDVAGLKSLTGLSRKYLIALLEYFDSSKLTLRIGDKRILRGR
jgi:selenocysteine-specific elongation factor